jgi:competence protein ComEC
VQQLDWLVVSHQDADHIGGMAAVLRSVPVKRILFNGTVKPKPQAQQLFELALARGVRLYEMEAGEQLQIDDFTTFTALAPVVDANPDGLAIAPEQNDYSLAGVLTMFETRILFTGDMGAATERAVLEKTSATGPLDVLNVAHHGSKSSTVAEWLAHWRPADAVISVGRNNLYRHPHPTVLQRLTASGATVWRTDRQGEIQLHLRADGAREWRTLLAP